MAKLGILYKRRFTKYNLKICDIYYLVCKRGKFLQVQKNRYHLSVNSRLYHIGQIK